MSRATYEHLSPLLRPARKRTQPARPLWRLRPHGARARSGQPAEVPLRRTSPPVAFARAKSGQWQTSRRAI